MKFSPKKKLTVYDPTKIEKKWQKRWAGSKIYKSTNSTPVAASRPKFYALDMFPYPSGEGLHVGHPKGYIATDIVSRMKRMQGMNVLHPMGFDAFGLPAENYALKTKTNPETAVKKNVARYKKQLELIGFDYDWSREVNTTDPNYYKWTQWIFLQLFKKGLAYESNEPINWCPSCKTGLANEDVEDGRCERCGTPVEKKPMRQWVLRITNYADRLLKDLDAHVLPNGDIFEILPNEEPVITHMNTDVPGRVRMDKTFIERSVACVFLEHWEGGKFVVLKWKKVDWMTPITGGVEDNQIVEEVARREIMEETGFKNLELVKRCKGQYHSIFFHPPKDHNRLGHFVSFHFKLKNGERDEITKDEQAIHEITWVPREKMRNVMTAEGSKLGWDLVMEGKPLHETKPLLDWPESIKELQRNWIGRSEGAEIDFRLAIKTVKTRFVLIHGYKGSPHADFFPWLKKELEKRGHEVEVPELPNPNTPTEEEQVGYVLKNCRFDENTVVVAHSLGSIVALKLIMKLSKPISGLVLVAAAKSPQFTNGKQREFWKTFSFNYDHDHIKKMTRERIAVLSDLGEPDRVEYLRHLSKEFGALLVETNAKDKHFCGSEEPEILKSVTPSVAVFTTRPDTIFGATYLVLAPEHFWVQELLPYLENKAEVEAYINRAKNETEKERTDVSKEKTGVELRGVKAINPANNEEIPVWVADYVLADYGTGAVMAVPAHDERDFEFANKFKLPVKEVVVKIIGEKKAGAVRRDGVACVIIKNDNYLILFDKITNEYRLAAGGYEKGETVIEALTREIKEETGYTNFKIGEYLGQIQSNFFALGAVRKDEEREKYQKGYLVEILGEEKQPFGEEDKDRHDLLWLSYEDALAKLMGNEHDCGEYEFLKRARNRTETCFVGEGILVNSAQFDGKHSNEIMKEITVFAGGKWVAKYKLRDWVFSRQRYWGEPIPLIHCEKCGVVAVPEKDLPVKLPKVKSYEPTGTGESPLAAIDKWVNVKCPGCGGKGKRETNTMPQWAGSSWYYLRYEDPKNKKQLVGTVIEKYWSPVDLYVGGAEHATRHLIYARFWHKFLYDIGVVSNIEPFAKLQSVGLIMGEDGKKMSKRFGNIVNPDDIVARYGADTLRIYEMFMGPFDQQIAWNTSSMVGSRRFIERIWKLGQNLSQNTKADQKTLRHLHKTIKKVTEDIESLRFNTAISALMICSNELEKNQTINRNDYETYLKLLAPFAPHITEELWHTLGNKKSIHISEWPKYDPALMTEDTAMIILQINGKTRGSFTAPINADKQALETAAKALPEAQKWLQGKEIKRVVVVPGKLVNFVL